MTAFLPLITNNNEILLFVMKIYYTTVLLDIYEYVLKKYMYMKDLINVCSNSFIFKNYLLIIKKIIKIYFI